jgi:hypothetical protein
MLLSKTVKVGWNASNKNYYVSKGYIFTKMRDEIEVDVMDLLKNSHLEILLQCDFCQTKFPKKFGDYINSKKQNLVDKDCCSNCTSIKIKELMNYKQENNIMNRRSLGYWSYKENRLKELDYCIKKYKKLDNIKETDKDYRVIASFYNYHHSFEEAIKELGYNINEVMDHKPREYFYDINKVLKTKGYYDNINNIIIMIQPFIDKYNRFPTITEIINNLSISGKQIDKHGGIYEIKRYMNYNDKYDLRDDNGFYNASTYEYIVAQWLIHNNISYKRNRHPFPKHEGNFMSDFTLYLKDNKNIHVEVWGMEGKKDYDKVKETKIKLYQKHNIKLISISSDLFLHFKIEYIQNELNNLFSPYINHILKFIPETSLIPILHITDDELLKEIMKYSIDKDYLPIREVLEKNKKIRFYDEIIKRYENYYTFAEKYNKLVYINRCYWDKNKIFKVFDDIIIEYNKLNRKNIKEHIAKNKYLHSFIDTVTRHGGFIKLKLEFYYLCLQNNNINIIDIEFIRSIINKPKINSRKITPYEQSKAQEILNKLNQLNTYNEANNIIPYQTLLNY